MALPEDEQIVQDRILAALRTDPVPDSLLCEIRQRTHADNAATLFPEYDQNRAKYREAVHLAAQWIRDELFRRALAQTAVSEEKNIIVFTAEGNAVGKSSALAYTGDRERAQIVLDTTLSNPHHAHLLIGQALAADKRVGIRYVTRPLIDTFNGMIERAQRKGRVVTIDQLVNSANGPFTTRHVLVLANRFRQ